MSTIRENIEYAIENSPKLLADGSSIACQGTEGSYSQEAANKIFRDAENCTDFEFMFYFDFESSVYRDDFIDVLERVEKLCDKMEYLGSYSEKF